MPDTEQNTFTDVRSLDEAQIRMVEAVMPLFGIMAVHDRLHEYDNDLQRPERKKM